MLIFHTAIRPRRIPLRLEALHLKTRTSLYLLIALAFLMPTGSAGSASSPDITDAAGDAHNGATDVVATWISSDATHVNVHFVLADLSSPNPATSGDTRYQYRVDFDVDGTHYSASVATYLAAQAGSTTVGGAAVDADAAVVAVGMTHTGPARTSSSASLDSATNTITLTFSRTLGDQSAPHPVFLAPGMSLDNVVVTTGYSSSPYQPSTVDLGLAPAWVASDSAGPGFYGF
ncbi:MAG: hypothetical protein QOE90_1677 [Thermoplasmata archaeon]|jgi:hypothetical protein|nr:hypothetical protein [Thermoplasmata archaeon]